MDREAEIELAWCAGFFEGEGCASYTESSGPAWHLSVRNTELVHLRRFGAAVQAGRLRIAEKPAKAHHKQAYSWRLASKDEVLRVALLLLPYMRGEKVARLQQIIERGGTTNVRQQPVLGFQDLTGLP